MSRDFNLEKVYDDQIFPLMSQIIDICREHQMPMLCSFQHAGSGDEADFCTTAMLLEEWNPAPNLLKALGTIRSKRSDLFAFTITMENK